MKARPLAPNFFAIAVSSSIWPMVMPANPLALIAFTTPPRSIAPRKTLNELSRNSSVKSTSCNRKTAIGLVAAKSTDRFAIGQSWKGIGISIPRAALKIAASIPSVSV